MTIISEVNRIKGNVSDAYDTLETKGATMPQDLTTDNLARTVATIETITIDSELSSTSTNPVQNKVITNSQYFKSGDKYSYNGYCRVAGLSAAVGYCYFSFILNKELNTNLSYSITKLKATIMDVDGNFYGGTGMGTPLDLLTKGSVTMKNISKNILTINYQITDSTTKPSGYKGLMLDIWELEVTFS